ncbi:MAG TPA: prenyltransferase [Chloroflexota bacterium]|nr:prenyltransferase [Chloroflexota bacterium]
MSTLSAPFSGQPAAPARAGRFAAGLWRLADPKISLASFAALFLGAAFAAREVPLDWGWLALTVAGIFALEVAKNASGEVFDFDSGADLAVTPENRSPFSGGKRVLVDGLLTRGQTWGIAAVGYALGTAAGLAIVLWREPGVLWLGLAGVACAWFYQAPPFKLSYRGFGELAVAVCYGPLITLGTYLVLNGGLAPGVVWASLPLGMLIAAFLWVNEFPDYAADSSAGKRTLVVQLGRRRAALAYTALVATALTVAAVVPFVAIPYGYGALLGVIGGLPALLAASILRTYPEQTARIIRAQALTLQAFVLYALGTGVGALLSLLSPAV